MTTPQQPPGTTPRVSSTATETLPRVAAPELDLRKQVTPTAYSSADPNNGDVLTYTMTATNSGTTTLTDVTIALGRC